MLFLCSVASILWNALHWNAHVHSLVVGVDEWAQWMMESKYVKKGSPLTLCWFPGLISTPLTLVKKMLSCHLKNYN